MNAAVGQGKKSGRFLFIDQFRGFVGVLMLLGHCSYYFNGIWHTLDPFEPLFSSWWQFALRYAGYLCAPGFLMMAGAMVWWSHKRRVNSGTSDWIARWHLIQRGLFLFLVQVTWVNSSWGGFKTFNPAHLGIIACIGISIILLTLIINTHWIVRLSVAIAILLIHPLLLTISYPPDNTFAEVIMQIFVTAGKYNKYPVLPWFAMAVLGSVMATGWLEKWKTDRERVIKGSVIAIVAFCLAMIVRLGEGYGNISPYSEIGHISFFLDQKYPPSLFMNLWFFGAVVAFVTLFIVIGKLSPKVLEIFTIPGKTPLFFYGMHLAILGVFVKRTGLFYREGGIGATLIGFVIMMLIMMPLCKWFYRVKKRSNNYIIKLI